MFGPSEAETTPVALGLTLLVTALHVLALPGADFFLPSAPLSMALLTSISNA